MWSLLCNNEIDLHYIPLLYEVSVPHSQGREARLSCSGLDTACISEEPRRGRGAGCGGRCHRKHSTSLGA